jgi:Na+-transporting methylmalonyl-CoA/oxaloacetate decarboxylase gamma subunit
MELFKQALMIMTLGMGLVFVFLFLVIQGLILAARIIHHFEGVPQEKGTPSSPGSGDGEASLHAAVIAVALEMSKSAPLRLNKE